LILEMVLAFALVFTVFSTAKIPNDKKHMGRLAPFAYGAAVLVGHLVGTPFSGASMNPARSFGPALISGYWGDHWVFWAGPIIGGTIGGLVYKYIFISPLDQEVEDEGSEREEE